MRAEMRIRLIGLLAAGLLAASAYATGAGATSTACTGPRADLVVALNVEQGFQRYLIGIGTPSWRKYTNAVPAGPYCGTADQVATAKRAYADQKRFYVLLMAFPAKPTRAQWNARFKPLVDAAIACDRVIIEIVGRQDVQMHDLAWLESVRSARYGTAIP